MANRLKYFRYLCSMHLKYNIIILCLIFSCITNAATRPQSGNTQSSQQVTTKQPQHWLFRQYHRLANCVTRHVTSNYLTQGAEHAKNKITNAHRLHHIMDDNTLYETLEKFKDKYAFEVLALAYTGILSMINDLDQDLLQAGLPVPSWLKSYRYITKKIKQEAGFSLSVGKTEKTKNVTRTENTDLVKLLNNRLQCYFSMMKCLLHYQVDTHKSDPLISTALNKQVDILILDLRKNNTNFIEEFFNPKTKLVYDLLYTYHEDGTTPPEFPVLDAFVSWCKNNAHMQISQLLRDSDNWTKSTQPQLYEENEDDQMLVSYLHLGKKVDLCDTAESFFDGETKDITTELLNTSAIKSLVAAFPTVNSLIAAYEKGPYQLTEAHNEQSKQANLSPEQKLINKYKKNINTKIHLTDTETAEYMQEGMKKNIKDSIPGKLMSVIWSMGKYIKTKFTAAETQQDKTQNAMKTWTEHLNKNVVNCQHKNKQNGHKLVMKTLIAINKARNKSDSTNMSLTDALTQLVEQRFECHDNENTLTLLTGWTRTENKKNKPYCDNHPTETNVHKFVDDHNFHHHKTGVKSHARTNTHASSYSNSINSQTNSEDNTHKIWLHIPDKSPPHSINIDETSDNNDPCDDHDEYPHLHDDWHSIIKDRHLNEEQCEKKHTASKGCSYGSSTFITRILTASMGACIILSCAQVIGSAPVLTRQLNSSHLYDNQTQFDGNSTRVTDNSTRVTDNSTWLEGNKTILDNNSTWFGGNETILDNNSTWLGGNETILDNNSTWFDGNATELDYNITLPDIIYINNVTDLNLIGVNRENPIDWHYQLNKSIDARDFKTPIERFTGILDGQGNTITGLSCCLINILEEHGLVRNITISNANIRQPLYVATIAVVSDNSVIEFIHVKNSYLEKKEGRPYNPAGIVASQLNNLARIENTNVDNSILITNSRASSTGGLTGLLMNGCLSINNTVSGCIIISLKQDSNSGQLIGAMAKKSASYNDRVENGSTYTVAKRSDSSAGVGVMISNSEVIKANIIYSTAEAQGSNSNAGIVLGGTFEGNNGSILYCAVSNSQAIAYGKDSFAGIFIGDMPTNVKLEGNIQINSTSESTKIQVLNTTEPENIEKVENVENTTESKEIKCTSFTAPTAESLTVPLLISSAGIGAIAGYIVFSCCDGCKERKKGWNLALRPFTYCLECSMNCYQQYIGKHEILTNELDLDIENLTEDDF